MSTHTVVTKVVKTALQDVALNPNTEMTTQDVPAATKHVVEAIEPTLVHLANQEPWYKSRVTLGAMISMAVPILGAFGVATDWLDLEQATTVAVALGSAVGGLLTLYGRWKAKRPIGE